MLPELPGFRLTAAVAAVMAAAVSLACGSSPGEPSMAAVPPLADGRFTLQIAGDSGLCQDIKNPPAGTVANVNLTATHDGETWIARGETPADGTIEMRLSRTTMPVKGHVGLFDIPVAGSISGVANDATVVIFPPGPTNRTVTFNGQVPISGIFRPTPKFADGYYDGTLTFSKDGVSSTCPAGAAGWFLNGPL